MKRNYVIRAVFISAILLVSSASFAQFQTGDNLTSINLDKKISLDLKGMDVIEVLKTLASKGNINIVIGSNVRGRVTMFLKNVNIGDAFEIILAANNLASDKRGDIIYVMTQRDYEQLYGEKYGDKKEARVIQLRYAKVPEVSKALNQIKTKIGKIIVDEGSNTIVVMDAPQAVLRITELIEKIDKPTTTKIFELNYAKVKDIKDKIQEMLTKGVGTVQIDERTNKLVVTDLEDKIDEIINVIVAFDARSQQVLIEAKIIEITLKDEYKLGVDWEVVSKEFQKLLRKDIGIKANFRLASQGELTPGGEILIGAFGSSDYAAMVQALKIVGDTNILSSPRITALNNEEAKILVGSNEPYATNIVTQGTATTTTATELTFLDIGIKLYVTPTINRDGFVTIKIRPEVSSKSGTYTYGSPSTTVPIISTTHAETSVMVKDGATIVIAGLIKDERTDTVNKVPFLGDIPILGVVFQKTEKTVEKKELVILITPHIISGETDYLEPPYSPPIGDELFTTPEKPTFERREPRKMQPGYFKEGARKKRTIRITPDLRASSPEEYFFAIKNRIIKNLSIPEGDTPISKGARVKISFSLYSGGNLASKPKVIESTNDYLGRLTIDAIEKTEPFPVFPLSIKEFKKDFSLDIVYESNSKNRGKILWRKE
ncbi:MAG: TonB C-terminal domain-containing protein [Candidatus Omnitrophica bacterium]|nr:TonB C-terminal domain-containing protein [Candidatus Omnitrophota bacterium]